MKERKMRKVLLFVLSALLAFCTAIATANFNIGVVKAEGKYDGYLTINDTAGAKAVSAQKLKAYHSAYNKTWVDVAEDEDLVIEFDLKDSGAFSNYNWFGIVKGLQNPSDETNESNVDAYLETLINVVKSANTWQYGAGFMGAGACYDDMRDASARSAGVIKYWKDNATKNVAGTVVYGLYTKSEKIAWAIGDASDYDATNCPNKTTEHKGFATSMSTVKGTQSSTAYKYVYLASGGLEIYARNEYLKYAYPSEYKVDDYLLIFKTVDTYGQKTIEGFDMTNPFTYDSAYDLSEEKVYVNRSGYVGFSFTNTSAAEAWLKLNSFKVSTVKDGAETVKIDEDYHRTESEYYNADRWGFTGSGTAVVTNPDYEEKVSSDENYAKMSDGTATLLDWQANALVGSDKGGMYYNEYVTVADDEDLVIEYDYIKDSGYYVGLMKGLQSVDGKVAQTAGAMVETVMAMKDNAATMLGVFDGTVNTAHSSAYSENSALNEYISASTTRQHYYGNGTYSVNFKGAGAGNTPKGFRTAGYTYKHVFLASGGYECYAKAIGAADSEYTLILKTADTYGEDSFHKTNTEDGSVLSSKIFSNRSGYVGFIINADNYQDETIEIDNFKVKTVGSYVKTAIDYDFDRVSFKGGAADNWKYIAGGKTTYNYDDTVRITAKMQTGAYIRVNDDGMSGIKFITAINAECADFLSASVKNGSLISVQYGTLITTRDILGEGTELNLENLEGKFYYNLVASGFLAEKSEGNYLFNANIVNIRPENYYREWVARGYAYVTTSDGTSSYYYADFDGNESSVYSVASKAYEDFVGTAYETVLTDYLDSVVIVNENGEYAGGVTGYIPAYTATVEGGVLTVTSEKAIGAVVYNDVWVNAAIEKTESGYTATFNVAQA